MATWIRSLLSTCGMMRPVRAIPAPVEPARITEVDEDGPENKKDSRKNVFLELMDRLARMDIESKRDAKAEEKGAQTPDSGFIKPR